MRWAMSAAADTTSGKAPPISLRSREKSRGPFAPSRWSCARIPSYLSSIHASSPTRRITSSASATGVASINRIGRPRCSAASVSLSSRARTAASPGSPTSISARRTAPIGRSKAAAIASSRSPSRRPMRSSRAAMRPMKRASREVARAKSSVMSATRAAALVASLMPRNAASTSASSNAEARGGWRSSSSAAASPRSECRR